MEVIRPCQSTDQSTSAARELGLGGAEIVFNPSATIAGLSEYLWKLEQPAHAVANAFFVGAINRVGYEDPWRIGEFYGQSYFCDLRGQIVAEAARDRDELVTAELDLDQIREVRNVWQFYRPAARDVLGVDQALVLLLRGRTRETLP
jgi:beta-ureidopropionase